MKTLLTVIISLCAFLSPMSQDKGDNFLDLTKKKVAEKKNEKQPRLGTVSIGVGAGAGEPRQQRIMPLKVTLLSINKHSYALGEEVIYEVQLENITENTLVMPWASDLDLEKVKPSEGNDPPGYVDAYLSLVIKEEVWGDQFVAGRGLYGSQLVPSSLKSLSPGETVRIRLLGRWSFGSADVSQRVLAELPRTFDVRAGFHFLHGNDTELYEPTLSANSLTVELRRRQQ